MTALPDELLLDVSSHLRMPEIGALRLASRRFAGVGKSGILDRLTKQSDRTARPEYEYRDAAQRIYNFVLPEDDATRRANFEELDRYGPGPQKVFRCVIPLLAVIPEKQRDFQKAMLDFPDNHRKTTHLVSDLSLFNHCIDDEHLGPLIDKSIHVLKLSAQEGSRPADPYLYEAVRQLSGRMNPLQAQAFLDVSKPEVDERLHRPRSRFATTTLKIDKIYNYSKEEIAASIDLLTSSLEPLALYNRVSALSDISDEIFKPFDYGRRAYVVKRFNAPKEEYNSFREVIPQFSSESTTTSNSLSSSCAPSEPHTPTIAKNGNFELEFEKLATKLEKLQLSYDERSRDRGRG